ncbi:MAG: enoyl-CoA hydratase-related protein [Deltaproteobacteria bacterium]|nr:enoyl-CoA hydratase-related protein [Deltaproteobacteria bacterium]
MALEITKSHEGRLLTLKLNAPPANIVDAQMMAALSAALDEAEQDPQLAAVILTHEGKHFSFGASVEEHLPGKFEAMIGSFHALCRKLAAFPVPLLATVGGQCLGGGMEIVLLASRVFAGPKARLGQPEIQLAVFAPVASALLPGRIGPQAAEDLLLTGRSAGAEEALALGLVQQIDEDPLAAAVAYAEAQLLPRSAFALRQAVQATRASWVPAFNAHLDAAEARYLGELMSGADSVEGLTAFVEKRESVWKHR